VCFGRGGTLATVTDAAVTLGYLDSERIRETGIELDIAAAERAVGQQIGAPLGLDPVRAADAVIRVLTEEMVHAVEEVTIDQGVDPRNAVLVSGGGAAGFNIVAIAQRLGCRQLVIPDTAAALSAAGGLLSEVFSEHAAALVTDTANFAFDDVNETVERLLGECAAWLQRAGLEREASIELMAEARYPGQVWELELPVATSRFNGDRDVDALREAFHDLHAEVYAVSDRRSAVEIVGWRARARAGTPLASELRIRADAAAGAALGGRRVYLHGEGWRELPVFAGGVFDEAAGPALVELRGTTVLLAAGTVARRSGAGAILVDFARGTATSERLAEAINAG
jgi:N-methylhydantoinase A